MAESIVTQSLCRRMDAIRSTLDLIRSEIQDQQVMLGTEVRHDG